MKTHLPLAANTGSPDIPDLADLPSADELAALRGWYAGLSSWEAVTRFLPDATINQLGVCLRAFAASWSIGRRSSSEPIWRKCSGIQPRKTRAVRQRRGTCDRDPAPRAAAGT